MDNTVFLQEGSRVGCIFSPQSQEWAGCLCRASKGNVASNGGRSSCTVCEDSAEFPIPAAFRIVRSYSAVDHFDMPGRNYYFLGNNFRLGLNDLQYLGLRI
jgi:hypothetical protein